MASKKKLAAAQPSISDQSTEFMLQFKGVDDRSAVILAGAMLEVLLGALLGRAMRLCETTRDPLLVERGVISSLYAKVHISYRLNLIDKETFQAIELIRDIRNTYAHKLEYSKLSDEPYVSQISNVYKTFAWYAPYIKAAKYIFGSNETGSMQFKTLATFVISRLERAIDAQQVMAQSAPFPFTPDKWHALRPPAPGGA